MKQLPPPDAVISLHPDRYAPRAARYIVGTVDRPSPDLRDVVMLLASELVTRAVMLCTSADEFVELRIWMPADTVRVELRAARELICMPPEPARPQDDLLLIDDLADRWSIDVVEEQACIWFEIDRQQLAGREGRDRGGRAFAPSRHL
jgi:hypothetical protein